VQTCIWPSWCHCHSLSLASAKSRLVLPFWYRPTRVVPEKGLLNGCVCVCVCDIYISYSRVSPDPLSARSLCSLGFPKPPLLKNPRSAKAQPPVTSFPWCIRSLGPIGRTSSPFLGPWGWIYHKFMCPRMASATPVLCLPSQPPGVTTLWLVLNYRPTAWWQRHMRTTATWKWNSEVLNPWSAESQVRRPNHYASSATQVPHTNSIQHWMSCLSTVFKSRLKTFLFSQAFSLPSSQ